MDFSHQKRHAPEPDFDEVAAALLSSSQAVCEYLLPGGVRRGGEYVCCDIRGGKPRPNDGSLSVNLKDGVWRDFATGVGGADLINLWTAVRHVRPVEAKREAADWLGLHRPAPAANPAAKPKAPGPDADDEDPMWFRDLKADKIWDYFDAHGILVAQVYRWRHPKNPAKKAVRPWNPETQLWEVPAGDRPLYNLPAIATTRGTVHVVEGEKCADALIADGWLATTVMMGAQAIAQTDWSPLEGRDVIAWRDNDQAGREWESKVAEALREAGAASLRTVTVPHDKPPKWDAYDATPEERVTLIEAAQRARPIVTGRPALTLSDWTLASPHFTGKAPERRWLVNEVLPLGVPAVLAAMGDTGKGMMLLDLALKVACDSPGGVLPATAFGCTITEFGRSVVLSAEDDQAELHRRLERLDQRDLRKKRGDRLHLVPLPNAGGAFPLIRSTPKGCETTDGYERLRDQLLAIENLKLIVIDPLASFVQADLNKDSAAGAFVGQTLAALGAETGATVLVAHHMAKGQGDRGVVKSPEQARGAIRGSTAIVDGVRAAYALWPVDKDGSRSICKKLGIDWERGRIVQGAVVKSNGPSDMTVRTYVRNLTTGLLEDITTQMMSADRAEASDIDSALVASIAKAAAAGRPFQKSGAGGIWERKNELPDPLRDWGKHKLQGMVATLLDRGRVVNPLARGSSTYVLDVPGGDFAIGIGTFERGSDQPVTEGGNAGSDRPAL